ncbi:chromosome segregation protein SMC [Geothermobacter hydrogeniphilus]|uniref:Chromosome partition protein Smc n=1 Tax=Geothermobacter hydrogeniphilus TaxID=1969733 RepID=A0A1X0XSC9_9BACT|nr:chromosome segregation protein SMC [Geothermobacter hydrogeniphilus]ORJ55822.1 chromosome segregation protein SMC [Geothermobacter hydrogeniphilus]
MKIKRLEIIGFKSFVDKVVLDFQQGVTGVVGPNGCGKSNIVDAIRWVMGEQNARSLRGKSMEDVIFGGSETRKPHGMAEVSLIFDNEDGLAPPAFAEYAEIMVTRRLYRSGESDYLLNKTPCRLLDIAELFMDTGVGRRAYSIIEQGKIGFILNAKPEDRRFLIEEAAGVTKFKARKKTATRKIDATRQNLLRLGDIISEVNRQLGSLKRQAQKAERYRRYREELKGIETRFALRRYRQLRGELAAAGDAERERGRVLEEVSGRLEQQELKLADMRLQQAGAEKELARGQEQVYQLSSQIQETEGRINFARQQHEALARQRERRDGESAGVRQRLEGLGEQEAALERDAAGLAGDLADAERRLSAATTATEAGEQAERVAASRQEEVRRLLFSLMGELTRLQNQQEDARRRLDLQQERTSRNRREATDLQEQLQNVRQEARARADALAAARQQHAALRAEQEQAQAELVEQRGRQQDNERELLAARDRLNRDRSRLESLRQLERSLEGCAGGVRTLLRDDAFADRFAGLVADHLQVPTDCEVAVEAVLGERLQSLVSSSVDTVVEALALLGEKGGRATFLLTDSPQPEAPRFGEGRHLADLARAQTSFGASLLGLLKGVYLVDRVRPWLRAELPFGLVLVDARGEMLTSRGEWSGGSSQVLGGGLLQQKREIKELEQQVAVAEQSVEALQQQRQQLQQTVIDLDERVRELGSAVHRQELQVVDGDQELDRYRREEARLLERVEVLSLEEDQLHEEQERLQGMLAEAEDGLRDKESGRRGLEDELELLQEQLQVLRRDLAEAREQLTSVRVEVASLREREEAGRRSRAGLEDLRSELQGRLALLAAQQQEAEEEQRKLSGEMEDLQRRLEVLFERREEEKRKADLLRDRFEEFVQGIALEEEATRELRRQADSLREAVGGLQMELREKELALDHLRQSFLERYRLDLADQLEVEDEPEVDQAAAERRMEELKRLIDGIGEVNLTAIEEFQELEERFNFLREQEEDLRRSMHGLQAAIAKINRTTRKRFKETFEQVNIKFQQIFPRLFHGGRAELQLTDSDDLLETGIDIIAQPPGKKLQGINLLSGGEKALTAVALIFAIFQIKPSPFCLLDEVDAPLDEANIGRFNEMVREMSEISQFIIITHNKRTMEMADTLYGVTMQEPGVSRLVSVKINEFQESGARRPAPVA